ncbi:MAG TPA: hypothetical protein VKA46_27750 [Gemmataceae bacterium]|nr:hypothetical protein [Gemmataceae bacterium]
MNKTSFSGVGSFVHITVVPVAGVTEANGAGLKTTWTSATAVFADEAALAHAVEEYPLSNERLLAYAARNPPPQSWYDEDEDLF